MLVKDRTVALEEVVKVRYLFQIGRDVRVIPREVHIIELDIYDVLDFATRGAELARILSAAAPAGVSQSMAAASGAIRYSQRRENDA